MKAHLASRAGELRRFNPRYLIPVFDIASLPEKVGLRPLQEEGSCRRALLSLEGGRLRDARLQGVGARPARGIHLFTSVWRVASGWTDTPRSPEGPLSARSHRVLSISMFEFLSLYLYQRSSGISNINLKDFLNKSWFRVRDAVFRRCRVREISENRHLYGAKHFFDAENTGGTLADFEILLTSKLVFT